MKNIDKLVDMIVHIERVLEKNIPTGYRQIVTEYVRQNMVPAVISGVLLIVLLIGLTYVIVQSIKLLNDYKIHGYYINMGTFALIYFLAFLTLVIATLVDLTYFTKFIQRIVAPNWYIINRLIHK